MFILRVQVRVVRRLAIVLVCAWNAQVGNESQDWCSRQSVHFTLRYIGNVAGPRTFTELAPRPN